MVNKKAVSPLVSTVLLIMIVIILAIIILLWAQGFVKEIVTKDIAGVEKRVEDFCKEIQLSQIINDDGSFGFQNKGNVPIYEFRVNTMEINSGSSNVDIVDHENGGAVNPGFSVIIEDMDPYDSYESIEIVPTLKGKTELGDTRDHICEDNGIQLK
ncbi:MAG: archaellin/type IV pilin N-terminal domain-containing protein [archaeon]